MKAKGKLKLLKDTKRISAQFEYKADKYVKVSLGKTAKGKLDSLTMKKHYQVFRDRKGRLVSAKNLGKKKVRVEIWKYSRTLHRAKPIKIFKQYIKRKAPLTQKKFVESIHKTYKNIKVRTVILENGDVYTLTESP